MKSVLSLLGIASRRSNKELLYGNHSVRHLSSLVWVRQGLVCGIHSVVCRWSSLFWVRYGLVRSRYPFRSSLVVWVRQGLVRGTHSVCRWSSLVWVRHGLVYGNHSVRRLSSLFGGRQELIFAVFIPFVGWNSLPGLLCLRDCDWLSSCLVFLSILGFCHVSLLLLWFEE